MFSPEASVRSVRSSNPRRRQRKDSDGPQQPRRKRSKIAEDAFQAPNDVHINGNGSAIMNGHAGQGEVDGSLVMVDLPVRDKKLPAKRPVKDDAGLFLTKNDDYSVKRLPSFPAVLSSGSTPFRASALPSSGLALALTTSHALIWDYTSATGPTKVLTLSLPFGLKPSDPLPFGAIVRNGPTNDFGIFAVAPSSGKMTFWENVDSAEARNHFPQRHQGIDGLIKLHNGETVVDIVDIEHAGFMLVMSAGRLVQVTLRDMQGRPSINTSVLPTPSGSSGSFFSFKGLLGSAIRRSIAAVRARASESKGQMDVITATKNGVFQTWDLNWSGHQVFKAEFDVQSEILAAVQGGTPPEARGQQEVHILDFAILEHAKARAAVSVLVLVALSGHNFLEYTLLELDLADEAGSVNRAIPIRNLLQESLPKEPTGNLLLPASGHTAFVQFPHAVAIASLAEPEESPDAQLLSDSGKPSLPYQDIVYFRSDRDVDVCGSAFESVNKKDRRSIVVFFVQGYGALQFSALHSIADSKVTARNKLEQATFFSTTPDNILDFAVQSRYSFAQEEVEAAALDISSEILSSSVEYVEKVTTSMDDQIRKRSIALETLISHLRSDYPPLSSPTKWQLLWNAEKLAAALAIWQGHQDRLQDQEVHPDAHPETLLLPYMVRCVHEKFKTSINKELGETDPLRQWFLRDISMIHVLLPWAWQVLRLNSKHTPKERPAIMQRISEGNDVILAGVEAALKFREENADLYGLDHTALRDGVLMAKQGYDVLPEFWTSTHNMVAAIRSLVDIGRTMAEDCFEKGVQEDLAMKIAKDNPRLVRLCCQTHIERFRWAIEQNDEQKKEMGESLREEWNAKVRPEHIYSLVDIGMATEGMNLAEAYFDMPTLVRLIWDETKYMEESKASSQSKMEQAECTIKLNRIKERIHRYFDKYGSAWAEAFYSQYITEGQSGHIFLKDYLNQKSLTQYLRAHPSRAKLTWINEVAGEHEFESAHDALYEAGAKQESNAWCKKVELSLAKLALMSKKEVKPDNPEQRDLNTRQQDKLVRVGRALEYVKVQDQLYDRLIPFIQEALDEESAVRLLMSEFGQGPLAEKPAHQQLLQQGFENLINKRALEPALLIDVLTLMNYKESSDEFALALKVVALSWNEMHKGTRDNTLRLVWKRLCIKDDWATINNTKDVSDSHLGEYLANETFVGWTFQLLLSYIDKDPIYQTAWPRDLESLLGAGCTNGELCVRFSSEDLRNPIIADNLVDDQVLQTNIEKHRLNDWFPAVCEVAKKAHEAEGDLSQSEEAAEDAEEIAGGFEPVLETEIVDQISAEQEDVEMQE